MAKKNALKPCVYVNTFGMGVAVNNTKNERRSYKMVKIDVKPEQLFPVKCAWCGKTTRFSTIGRSHSICKECKDKLLLAGRLAPKEQ